MHHGKLHVLLQTTKWYQFIIHLAKESNFWQNTNSKHMKDYFQFVLRSLNTIVFIYIIYYKSHSMECRSMLFVTLTTYLIFEGFQILFPTAFIDFYNREVVSSSGMTKNEA